MDPIPVVGLGDDADIVATCKLASIVLMSNESAADASVNLTQEFGDLLRDSASAELDRGVLYGSDDPEPRGLVAAALPAAGDDLGAAVTAAIGSIGDSGGVATHLAARPSVLADARNERDSTGQMMYPNGLGAALGLAEVGVPELAAADILVDRPDEALAGHAERLPGRHQQRLGVRPRRTRRQNPPVASRSPRRTCRSRCAGSRSAAPALRRSPGRGPSSREPGIVGGVGTPARAACRWRAAPRRGPGHRRRHLG